MQHLQSPQIPGFWSLLTWCSGQSCSSYSWFVGPNIRQEDGLATEKATRKGKVLQSLRWGSCKGFQSSQGSSPLQHPDSNDSSNSIWAIPPEAAPQIFREPPIKNVSFPLGSGIDLHRNTGISIRVSNWFTLGSFPMGHQHVPGRSRSSPAGRSAFPGTGYSAVLGTSGLPGQSCPWARRDERWGRRDDQNGPWMVVPPPSHAEERGNYQATDPTDLQHSL